MNGRGGTAETRKLQEDWKAALNRSEILFEDRVPLP